MRRTLGIALLIMLSAAFAEGLATVGLRSLPIPYDPIRTPYLDDKQREQIQALLDHQPTYLVFDRTLGWTIAPSAVSVDGLYHSNAQGLRADREYSRALPADRVRLLAYGDSFTHCDDVAYGDSWEVYLEGLRPELEVVNAGVPAYTLDQALLRFEERSPPLDADIVTIGFMSENINRIVNVFRPFYTSGIPLAKPRFLLQGDDLALLPNPLKDEDDLRRLLAADPQLVAAMAEHDDWYNIRPRAGPEDVFATARLVKAAWSSAKRVLPRDSLIDWRGSYKTSSEGFVITVKLFDRFAREAEARGALPLILLFPHSRDLLRGFPHRHAPLTQALREKGLAVIDLADALDQPATAYGITEKWIHYTPAANAVVAETIARYLTEHDLLQRGRVQAALAILRVQTMRQAAQPRQAKGLPTRHERQAQGHPQ